MAKKRKIVTLTVATRNQVRKRAVAAFSGEQQDARISFASIELLWKTLNTKRWDILRAMTGQGALSIREVARQVDRDVKAVHGDVHILLNAGVIDRNPEGLVVFPYDVVHVDFELQAA